MKAIYKLHLQDGSGLVHISDVAAVMGLRKASVCRATNILAERGYVRKDRYVGVYLTESGLDYALFIEQRYAIVLRFLSEVLSVDADTAEGDACRMEHVISPECYQAIRTVLRERDNN